MKETTNAVVSKDGWISVDTAPKDGKRILGYDDNTEEIYIVWWNPHMGNGCWYCISNYLPKIIKWQPLPLPPGQPSKPEIQEDKQGQGEWARPTPLQIIENMRAKNFREEVILEEVEKELRSTSASNPSADKVREEGCVHTYKTNYIGVGYVAQCTKCGSIKQ